MSDNSQEADLDFLRDTQNKIKIRIAALSETLAEGEEDVARMHDYYWDNYTEMDEYGYENYDNQQALLSQIKSNTEALKQKALLKKMLANPYFGRVDFLYDGDDSPETIYIGLSNFSEGKGDMPLIFDWRAPVSSLFYDYDKGPAAYDAPLGRISGEITSKWQYKIRHGKLIYAFESDTKIDDEILRQELGGHGETTLKNLVRTIQKEQNAIIRNTEDKILVIQGTAGSGKSSVALHRIAYLLYHDREHLKSSQVLILTPGGVFTEYISHILPELGEENIKEMNFDLFAYRELSPYIDDCEDCYDRIENKLASLRSHRLPNAAREAAIAYKSSAALPEDIRGYVLSLEDTLVNFKPITIHGWTLSERQILDLFYFKFMDIPLLERMDVIYDYAVDAWETLTGKTLSEEDAENLHDSVMKMYTTRDIYIIYSQFLEMMGFDDLPHVPKSKRFLNYEDVYPLLYLKYLLLGKGQRRPIRHLVIDEMQDYSPLQYEILAMLFDCPMTILGDKAQTMDEKESDVTKFLPSVLGKTIRFIEMNKSYRNTMEISRYAASLRETADTSDEYFERHGEAVTVLTPSDEKDGLQKVLSHYVNRRDSIETAALITFSEQEARKLYEELKPLMTSHGLAAEDELNLITKQAGHFKTGLTVIPFYLAKGLEFDDVCGWEWQQKTGLLEKPLIRQARYITATRALHKLIIVKS